TAAHMLAGPWVTTRPGEATAFTGAGSSGRAVTTPVGEGGGGGAAVVGGLATGTAGLGAAADATRLDGFGALAGFLAAGCATGVGRADAGPPLAPRKSSVTKIVSPLTMTPIPTWLNLA